MASDLMSIAASGARVARQVLDITAQNIANAATEGYVRRTARIEEMAASGTLTTLGDISMSGARLGGVIRNADLFRQTEVRRTSGDAARAATELGALENIESALEDTQAYEALVGFEASLERLATNPVDPSLRAAVLEDASTMARSFNIASQNLDAIGENLLFEAEDAVAQFNLNATELARINVRLAQVNGDGADRAALMDQRDRLLDRLAASADIETAFSSNGTVQVRLGDPAASPVVSGNQATPLAIAQAADGTFTFTVAGTAATISGGALAGKAQARVQLNAAQSSLDAIAANLATAMNGAQASGADFNGNPGQAFFSGSTAGDIAMALGSWQDIATAPAGSSPGSRSAGNLDTMRGTLASADPAGAMNRLLFDTSSLVAGRRITAEALDTIAQSSALALEQQIGVDLDAEALNLVRFQQAFQASSRAMQVASSLFDSLLAIR